MVKKIKKNQIKKWVSISLIFALLLSVSGTINYNKVSAEEVPVPEVSGKNVLLMHQETGSILFEKDSHARIYPASITKVVTALVVLDHVELSEKVTADDEVGYVDGSKMYLLQGEAFTVEQLLYALLVESANDAALALGRHVAGSDEKFAEMMNQKAKEIGAHETHFVNAHGLHEDNHYSTAYDLALIGKAAMENETIKKIVKTKAYDLPATSQQDARHLVNRNLLLTGEGIVFDINGKKTPIQYPYATGIKTGTTEESGFSLLSSATKKDFNLISVVINSTETGRFEDSIKLFEYGLNQFRMVKLGQKGEIIDSVEVINGKKNQIEGILEKDSLLAVNVAIEKNQIEKKYYSKKLEAPIKKGAVLGVIKYTDPSGNLLGETNVLAKNKVDKDPFATFKIGFKKYGGLILKIIGGLIIAFFALVIGVRTRNMIRRKRRGLPGRSRKRMFK